MGFGVWSLQLVWGLGFGVLGLGFEIARFVVCGLWFVVWGFGFGVPDLGFGVSGFGFREYVREAVGHGDLLHVEIRHRQHMKQHLRLGLRVWGQGFSVECLGLRVWGLGFGVWSSGS